MDIMVVLQIIVLFGAIYLGVRMGGMGIGYAGGLGVVVLSMFLGMKSGHIAVDVILIIASVISAISALQAAGGLDYLVQLAEKLLRKHPKHINYLAPIVAYLLTMFAGTGHTAFSIIPVIVEVAKGQNIKPSAPLSLAVVASQVGITASPISAAVVAMTGMVEPLGLGYPTLLAIVISTSFLGILITSFLYNTFANLDLSKDKIYNERLRAGLVCEVKEAQYKAVSKEAKRSVLIFVIGVLIVVAYALIISKSVGLVQNPTLGRNDAIMSFMLVVGALIVLSCGVNTDRLLDTSVFKSGMNACICVLGIAWLGDTFVSNHTDAIKSFASSVVSNHPYVLAIVLYFASSLLYSQAATTKALIPTVIIAMGLTPEHHENLWVIVASFAAVSGLFVLPTYPTTLGAIAMDDTGTTRVGKYVFDHSFIIPGTLMVAITVALGFVIAPALM